MRLPVLVTIVFLLFSGCASPPGDELQSARADVARAYAAGAHRFATENYREASEALHEGETLVRNKEYDRARELLRLSENRAQLALSRSLEERAAQARAETAEAAKSPEKKPEKVDPPPPPPSAVKPKPPSTEPKPAAASPPSTSRKVQSEPESKPASPPPQKHPVKEGETLWSISARKEIYSDALLWPLLYRANRDQIKDPQQIYPGQTLTVPREITEKDKKEAREKARASEIFPVEQILKKSDPHTD